MMRKIIMFWLCALLGFTAASAATRKDDRQAIPTIKSVAVEFSPKWTVQILGGGAYTLGEADFADLLSPAAQLSVGYRFSRLLGARVSFSGWQAKGRYNYPFLDYQWNYLLTSSEVVLDVTSILAGWRRDRLFSLNLFVGGGVAAGFRNVDAARMCRDNADFHGFEKLWTGTKAFWCARGGLEINVRLTHRLSLCLQSDAMMFPDDFNSKVGKDDAFDWQFNSLLGVRFRFGR